MICGTCGYDHEGTALKDCVAALQRDLAFQRKAKEDAYKSWEAAEEAWRQRVIARERERDGARLVIKVVRDLVGCGPDVDVAEAVAAMGAKAKKPDRVPEIIEWLRGLKTRLGQIIERERDPQMVARRGIYDGIADDIRDKWLR